MVSLKRRTFSIAITAWAENVVSSANSLSLNGPPLARVTAITPSTLFSRSIGAAAMARAPMRSLAVRDASPTQSAAGMSGT